MKRIDRIHLKNFKAFRDETIHFEGKNALIYGNNGSGKSSLFWAIYTFLQSSTKNKFEILKYFQQYEPENPSSFQSLKNVFAIKEESSFIALTWIDEHNAKGERIISDKLDKINTNNPDDTVIAEANLASDFINYKLLQNFYNESHKDELNLWRVFMRDIFPYFSPSNNDEDFRKLIEYYQKDVPRTARNKVAKGSRKTRFNEELTSLNNEIETFILNVKEQANNFLTNHFFNGEKLLELEMNYLSKLDFEDIRHKRTSPKISLVIKSRNIQKNGWDTITRPHSFLNEAQLTRIAVAVRFGALLTRIGQPDFKVLCLDDMLISLDMSNRMKVVDLILNKDNKQDLKKFDELQKIILTHDKAFFNLIKRDTSPLDWKYFEMERDELSESEPKIKPHRSYIEKAKQHLDNNEYEQCAALLRKELEELMKRRLGIDIPNGVQGLQISEHKKLGNMLNEVKKKLLEDNQSKFKRLMNKEVSFDLIEKFGKDFEIDDTLTNEEKGKLIGLRKAFQSAMKERQELQEDAQLLISEASKKVDFVLNASVHSTTMPLYEGELREAYEVVNKLKTILEMKK